MLSRQLQASPPSMAFYVLICLTSVFVLSDIVISSRMYVFAFGAQSRVFFLGAALAIVCIFALLNFIDGDHLALGILLSLATYLLLQHLAFSLRTGIDFNLNVLAQCYGFLGFNVFYALSRRGMLNVALSLIFVIAAVYLMIYCVVASLFYLGLVGDLTAADVYTVLSDAERGDRLFLASGHATFVLMFSLVYLVQRSTYSALLTLCLSAAAIALSISRVLIVTDALVLGLFVVTRRREPISLVAIGLYAVIVIYLLWGIVFTDFNPFAYSSTDTSTLYRRGEFTVMVSYIKDYPLFGVGLYDNVDGLAYLTGRSLLFPSDIGIVGVCFMFGITGAIVFGVLPAIICCFQHTRDVGRVLHPVPRFGLLLLGASLGIYSSTAMTIFNGADGMFFGILLATWLRDWQAAQVPAAVMDGHRHSRAAH